jgi:hypothetical protein
MMRVVAGLVAGGLALLALQGCNAQLLTQTDVLDVDNFQAINPTGNFTLAGTWDLKYAFDCSKQRSQGLAGLNQFGMTVYNSDDDSANAEHPTLNLKGSKGGATIHFKRGGTFRVKIDSRCDWRISVIDTNSGH